MGKIKKECSVCGIIVERWPSQIRYSKSVICSRKCLGIKMADIYREGRIERICEICECSFLVSKAIANKSGSGRFCSIRCKTEYMRKKLTGTRRKINEIINKGNYCEMIIKNKKGVFVVLFDTDDLDRINKYRWIMGNNGYARAHIPGSRKIILLHRLILNTPDNMDTDHSNHDKCDNRKTNLRICTTSQNMVNIHIKDGKKYKGVHKSRNGTFYAKNANIHLGTFSTPELAAQAYNDAVKSRYGNFAQLNKI